ncbi:universal stress protein [uncultured Rhodospira sp.]|uniref:universal stress protein n=1 Tax=uncultured Rhodospira sp. TaxID=1936189 RepID=UPI002612DD2C|nr:universal stress protein [uncultured Rhodospira sp.]
MTEGTGLHCLVATDLSARGDRALVRGFRMAAASHGSVVVLHVVEDAYPPPILKHIRDDVRILLHQQVQAMPESAGVAWRVEVVPGHDFEEIIAHAFGCNLIVLGGGRETRLSDQFLTSTTQRVVRRADVPVLTVKTPYRGPYGLAVVALDDTDPAERAVTFALDAYPDMRVVAFHAVDVPSDMVDPAEGGLDAFARPIRDRLARVPNFADRGRFTCERGAPVPTLDALVTTHTPDLVVLGRPRRGWSFLLAQDLPGHALMSARADILVAP